VAPERAVTVHEGIDLAHVAAAPAVNLHEELWLPHGSPIVGNIAALVPHKGQKHLVEAAALVVRRVPDARFVIAGEGELRESLEHQIKHLGVEKHVLLTGFRPDVLSVLKAFDVFVMSSVTEGLGTSLLDAMACAKPIVATTAGGMAARGSSYPRAIIRRWRMRSCGSSKTRRCASEWGRRACRSSAQSSHPSGWCSTPSRLTSTSIP
jgi:glycosyltransferase involved in cell wall biosynthesis